MPSGLRNDGKFDEFWQKVCDKVNEVDVNEPALPRRRKVPRRYEIGDGDGDHPSTPKQHYLTVYFESLDLIKAFIVEGFDQPGYRVYSNLEKSLIKAASGEDSEEEF